MSFSSPDNLSLASLGSQAGVPSLNVADIPANVRNGDKRAREAYAEGLAFEQVLVTQLTRQMASTLDGSNSAAGTGNPMGGSSSGALSGASAFSSLIPQALTQGIMSGGGLGIAEEFAASVDPALAGPQSAATTPKVPPTTSTGSTDQVKS